MAGLRHRRRQRGGAIVMTVAYLCIGMTALAISALYIGRWLNQQEEAQNRADAVSLAAMLIARKEGTNRVCGHGLLRAMMEQNGNIELDGVQTARLDDCGRFVEIRNPDGTISYQFVIGTSTELERGPLADPLLGNARFETMRSRSRSAITQENFDDAERRRPKFVLVLDYSGSMNAGFGGSTRIATLKRAVNRFLNLRLEIEIGVVIFSSDVIDVEATAFDNGDAISDAIDRRADGSTNYQAALDAARGIVTQGDNTGRYVLFISDGAPTAGGDPLNAADRLRGQDTTIFTLNIGGGQAQADLLRDMGGNMDPDAYGNDDYYFSAVNEDELFRTFEAIISNILCAVGPLQANQDLRPDDVYVFLKEGGVETPLPRAPNLADDNVRDTLAHNYTPAERKVRLTEAACDRVIEDGAEIVVRYGNLNLVQ